MRMRKKKHGEERINACAELRICNPEDMKFGLDKFLGASSLDAMAFGRATKSIRGKGLVKNAISRILKDAWQEGTEEVLQDLSDYLVDRIYTVATKENFTKLSNFDTA